MLDNLRNYTKKLELLNWYNKHINIKNNIILFNRKEEYFVDDLEKVLCQMDIHGIKQCHILNYYIDYYLPSINIAIEYDENKHKGYTYEQQTLRQEIIERELGCSFVRVDDSNDNLTNIGIILNEIMNIKTA